MKIVEAVLRNGLGMVIERTKLELNPVTRFYDLPKDASEFLSLGDTITIEEREVP